MKFTGERMVPDATGGRTFWEHLYRYRFACPFVKGRRGLDVACGEGYGTAALVAAGAKEVVGVDVSAEACAHARLKYGVDARQGDALQLPIRDASVDVVVSFETIEHLDSPPRFLDECWRVLADNGTLVISSPNKSIFRRHCPHNEFHPSELEERELRTLLRERFQRLTFYGQTSHSTAWWSPSSLAVLNSPWRDVRGCWRLQQCLERFHSNRLAEAQEDPVASILRRIPVWTRILNPYLVRRRREWTGEEPTYILAVGRKQPPR
jgi:SAM-dependent methyltransferase